MTYKPHTYVQGTAAEQTALRFLLAVMGRKEEQRESHGHTALVALTWEQKVAQAHAWLQ